MKRIISLTLMFAFCLNILTGIFLPNTVLAMSNININNTENTKNTKIIKATDNEIIYTYEQDGVILG